MKKILAIAAFSTQVGCTTAHHYPAEGNVSAKEYQHVSGVHERRSAAAETAMLVGSATVSAAAGGTAVPGSPNMRTYTIVIPNLTNPLPEGCEVLTGNNIQ